MDYDGANQHPAHPSGRDFAIAADLTRTDSRIAFPR